MIYKTKPRFQIDLLEPFMDAEEDEPQQLETDDDYGIIDFNKPQDCQEFLKRRVAYLNGGTTFANPYRLDRDAGVPEIRAAYFGTIRIPDDYTNPRSLNDLKRDYQAMQRNEQLILRAQTDDQTAREELKKHCTTFAKYKAASKFMLVAATAKIINDHTIVSVAPNGWFNDQDTNLMQNINIVEDFDFTHGTVKISVYFATDRPLTVTQQQTICKNIDGAMSDGWGENYNVLGIDSLYDYCVSSYDFFDENERKLTLDDHGSFLTLTANQALWLDAKQLSVSSDFSFLTDKKSNLLKYLRKIHTKE